MIMIKQTGIMPMHEAIWQLEFAQFIIALRE